MNKERWEQLQGLFEEALHLRAEEQVHFIEQNAGPDTELSSQVFRMLERDAKACFLDCEINTLASELFEESELPPLETIGPYRILYELGAGGMGVVYLAERPDWHKRDRPFKVAIKIPRDIWISHDRLRRFHDEQRLLAQLVHPSIARIYEAGTLAGGTPWFAMEYVDGEPITKYCNSRGSSIAERLQLVLAVCDAVQYAHGQAIIHRDLKPSNILVTPAGDVKLLDFGIGKQIGEAIDSTVTRVGLHPVTPAYAPPEQVLENRISTQADVYSIGVILYELLTGRLPFNLAELTPLQVQQRLRTQEPEKPSLVASSEFTGMARGSEWADLNVLILTAIHRDQAKRYDSADALRRDIFHYLKSEPLEARADSFGYRAGKFLKRRRLPVLLSAAALLLIVGVVSYYTVRLQKARDAALAEASRTRLARQFTEDLLEGNDPAAGPSKDLRVVDLLEPGLKKAAKLKDDPVQQAELYTTIGSLFVNFGEFAKGDAALHSAYHLLTSAGDANSHDFAEVLVQLGLMYSAEGQQKHAESCIRKGLAVEEQIIPPDEKLRYKYKTAVAYVLVDNQPRAAIAILNQLVNNSSPAIGDDLRSDVWVLLTTAHINLGEYAQAEPFEQRVLAYTRKTSPAMHPDLATELVNLAVIQRSLKQYGQQEQTFREALKIDEAWYPKGNPETGDVKRFLAETLFTEGKFAEAEPFARQALADEQRAYGKLHRRTAFAFQINGRLALQRGDLDEAEADFKQEIPALRALNDVDNLPRALSFLGDVYLGKHQYSDAAKVYRESLTLFPRSVLDNSGQVEHTKSKLLEALRHCATGHS